MKKKEKATLPRKQLTSVPSPETQVDTGESGGRVVVPITSPGTPLKIRQQSGMTYADGDESSYSRTFGTFDADLGLRLFTRVLNSLPAGFPDSHNYVLSALQGIGPKDALEGILAGNMVAVNDAAMHFLARATAQDQTFEAVDANLNWAIRLFRTFNTLTDTLNRYRGKIGPPVVVGSVSVSDGSQAIVGCVQHSGSERSSKDK